VRHYHQQPPAFTLLELIIVIIIVGILSSLALPRLVLMIERTYMSEAVATIGMIRRAVERCYIQNNGLYHPCYDDWHSFHSTPGHTYEIYNPDSTPRPAGSHFDYSLKTSSWTPKVYSVCATRRRDTDPLLRAKWNGEADCYYVCMGFGMEWVMSDGEMGSGCTARGYTYNDGKFYWSSEPRLSAYLPKNN